MLLNMKQLKKVWPVKQKIESIIAQFNLVCAVSTGVDAAVAIKLLIMLSGCWVRSTLSWSVHG